MFGELSRKYSEHINNLVESVERVSYALFVHEPGHAGHLYIDSFFLDPQRLMALPHEKSICERMRAN